MKAGEQYLTCKHNHLHNILTCIGKKSRVLAQQKTITYQITKTSKMKTMH